MCYDDSCCNCSCRYACCRKAIATAPNSQLRVTELLPPRQLQIIDQGIKKAEEVNGKQHDGDDKKIDVNDEHVKAIEDRMINDINPQIMELLNNRDRKMTANNFANIDIRNEIDKLQHEDLNVMNGVMNYYEYYAWLKFLRQPQKWWENSYEKCCKTFIWYLLGIIFGICFATPMWLLYVIFGFISNTKSFFTFMGNKCTGGLCCSSTQSQLQEVSRCYLTKSSSSRDSFVFSCFRAPTYYFPGTYGVFWDLARLMAGAFRVCLMPDGALLAALLSGPCARDLRAIFSDGEELCANDDPLEINNEIFNEINTNTKLKTQIIEHFNNEHNGNIENKVNNSDEFEEKFNVALNNLVNTVLVNNNSNSNNTISNQIKTQKVLNTIQLSIDEIHSRTQASLPNQPQSIGSDTMDVFVSPEWEIKQQFKTTNNKITFEQINPGNTIPYVQEYYINLAEKPLPMVQQMTLFDGYYLRAKSLTFKFYDAKKTKYDMIIELYKQDGSIFKMTKPKDANEPDYISNLNLWNVCKAHVQVMLCWYAPAWTHNFVHFHFLDVATARSFISVTKKSVLGVLLSAHLKYISVINIAGTADGIGNPQSDWNCARRCLPWKVQPVSTAQFKTTIAQNTVDHYLKLDNVSKVDYVKSVFPPWWVKVRRWYGPNDTRNHPQASQYRGIIPYLDYLSDYFYVIQTFIKKLWNTKSYGIEEIELNANNKINKDSKWLDATLLEQDMYEQWLNDLERNGLPGIRSKRFHPIDILSTLIWTSSVVHCGDHITYGSIFENFPMYASTVPFDGNGTWQDILWNAPNYAYKSKTFLDFYVVYHFSWLKYFTQDMLTSPKLYDWSEVAYDSKRQKAQLIHSEYLQELQEMNKRWGWLLDNKCLAASTCY